MKVIHYTNGYGGNLNYKTYCNKEIHSHSKEDGATLDPKKVSCEKCLNEEKFKIDLNEHLDISNTIKRRIYIESDVLHASELRTAQREVADMCKDRNEGYARRVFQEVLDYAWHDLENTWESVKKADEIYSQSSLMPLSGGSYVGAPVIFNKMCEKAIKENVTGKDVYVLNEVDNIYWGMIDMDLMVKAFEANNLFMYNDSYEIFKIDVKEISKKNNHHF